MLKLRIPGGYLLSFAVLLFAIYLYFLPAPIDPIPYYYPKPLPVLQEGSAVNSHLKKAQRKFAGQIIGPESFASDNNGTIYTGTADGKIIAFKGTQLRVIARTGQDLDGCGTFALEPLCGRPKGMKMNPLDPNNSLIFIDSYAGLQEVNVHTGDIITLISTKDGVNNVPFHFLNALDITQDGVVYFTDSSLKWDRRNYRYEVIEVNRQGRLMNYDIKTGRSQLLLDKLYLANGIALSADESVLVVAEMSACRIRRYHLKGEKAGQSDILIENLPGYPDNIKLNSRGNFYVGMGSVRYYGVSKIGPFLDLIGPYPAIKRFLTKITPLRLFDIFMPKHSIILEIDLHGNIVSSLHDLGAEVVLASGEGFEHNGTLYVGSFWAPYVGQLNMSEIRD